MKPKSWLWPDRVIGKRESRQLREEHNSAVNDFAELLEALELLIGYVDESDRAPTAWTKKKICVAVARAAIAKARGE